VGIIINFQRRIVLKKPWEVNQDLTKKRIMELADYLVSIREEVIDMHDEELGDTRLSLGMRAYECCRSRLTMLSDSKKYPWLSILTPDGRFTFCIGDTPVRFIRHEPKEIPNKKLIISKEAGRKFEQLSLFPGYKCKNSSIRWFFVIDTYYKNPADIVFFIGYDENGDIQSQWIVPIEDKVSTFSTLDNYKSEPVEIPAPQPHYKKETIIKIEKNNGKK